MSVLQCVLFKKNGAARYAGHCRQISARTIIFSDESVKVYGEELSTFYCLQEEVESGSVLLRQLFLRGTLLFPCAAVSTALAVLPLTKQAARCVALFDIEGSGVPSQLFLTFCYLFFDWDYFSSVLQHAKKHQDILWAVLSLMGIYACKAWPSTRYAQAMGCSLKKFNGIFFQQYGVSAKVWMSQQRLLRARALLQDTALSVSAIAEVCGFENHAYFSARFKKKFSQTPRSWRCQYPRSLVCL